MSKLEGLDTIRPFFVQFPAYLSFPALELRLKIWNREEILRKRFVGGVRKVAVGLKLSVVSNRVRGL